MIRSVFVLAGLAMFACLALPSNALAERDPVTGEKMGNVGVYSFKTEPRRVVPFAEQYRPGTIIVKTAEKRLYYVLDGGKAIRYGIGVGREGSQFSGQFSLTRKAEWPGWTPTPNMHRSNPNLPSYVPGGPRNPMGARALYIGATLYRIHGTNEQWSIGREMSSGCIRMTNEDVIDLYDRAALGSQIVVVQ